MAPRAPADPGAARPAAVGDECRRPVPRRDDHAGREHRRPARRARGRGADRRPQRASAAGRRRAAPALHARRRLLAGPRAGRADGDACGEPLRQHVHGRLLPRGAAHLTGRGGVRRRARGRAGHQRRRRVLAARHAAHRAPLARPRRDRRARHHLSGGRRPRPAGAAARHARRARARDGALAGGRLPPALASGRPTSPPRRAPRSRGCCSAPTTTSRPSAGWRRSPAGS